MSEVKQKTKMKTGTVAIVALSLVLVLSLVATITLAYFTASRNVVTTIQFANGVSLQMYGVAFKQPVSPAVDPAPDTPPSNRAATLYWLAKNTTGNGGTMQNNNGTNGYGGYEDVNDVLEFQNMRIRTVDADAYVAIKLIVTATKAGSPVVIDGMNGFALPQFASGWELYDATTAGDAANVHGAYWYVYTGGTHALAKLSHNNVTGADASTTEGTESAFELIFGNYSDGGNPEQFNQGYKIPNNAQYMNDFAGILFTFRVIVVASDTQTGLNDMIDGAVDPYDSTTSYTNTDPFNGVHATP